VRVSNIETNTNEGREGERRYLRISVELGEVSPNDVRVQVLHGPIDSQGSLLSSPQICELTIGADHVWSGDYVVGRSGAYGLTARVLPSHPLLANAFELGRIAWAD
jgi:starch phosphorylase